MLRYRLNTANGSRKENALPIGLLRDLPTEKAAWREVDRLGLLVRINSEESGTRIRFDALAEYYLKVDFGDDAVRPKSVNTIPIVEHYVRTTSLPAGAMKSRAISGRWKFSVG
jgi:hypothetical protein